MRFRQQCCGGFNTKGIDCRLIERHASRIPGLFAIETDPDGERSFRYWRDSSAARTLFSGIGASLADLGGFDVIYLSGITLAILPPEVRVTLIDATGALQHAGKLVVFDPNHWQRIWPDPATARASFDPMWAAVSLALPSLDERARLYPGLTPQQAIDRIAGLGPQELVLKNGTCGPMIRFGGATSQTALPAADRVVDTSGAGDSFNAAYLAARVQGDPPLNAAAAGHHRARAAISHHGAVIPREAMPDRADRP